MDWHSNKLEDIFSELNTSRKGLNEEEVIKRRKTEGLNEIITESKSGPIRVFLRQFKDPLIHLLIIAGLISFFVNTEKPIESYAIFAIVLINTLLGFFQEFRAEKALEALSKMAPNQTVVIRNGTKIKINAKELVAGDIVYLEAGDLVPADCRIIDSQELKTNEASLTGESNSIEKVATSLKKETVLAERKNMLYLGTSVVFGLCTAVVVSTGIKTEFGKIAKSLSDVKEKKTPLQQKFSKLARQITYFAAILIILVFIIGYLAWNDSVGELLLFGLVLAVGTVPSALPLIVTFSLSLGAKQLAAKNMLLRSLPAAESMGSVDFICTDKTGTLTKNEMTVTKLFIANSVIEVKGSGYDDSEKIKLTGNKKKDLDQLAQIALNCNSASIKKGEKLEIIGDPTEAALIVLANKAGLETKLELKKEFPFDSVRKKMSVVTKNSTLVKGAPEILIKNCTHMMVAGKIKKITPSQKKKILEQQKAFAQEALRVLGFAFKKKTSKTLNDAEKGLIFVGLAGMQDPAREEVNESIKECKSAGIKVMMITGDHITTAQAIGKKIGLLEENKLCLEGEKILSMNDEELNKIVEDIGVIARATPELKLRIVTILQKRGHVVAMTGDGVNDAPALKKANVGLAMGITGSDVAKESSKGILLDDNFATIVKAIKEGRNIYDKIIKSAKYLLSCNFGEIITVLGSLIIFRQLPLQPLQILMINMLTDSAPAVGLGMEKSEDNIMERKPRKLNERPISKEKIVMILLFGFIMGMITVAIFGYHKIQGIEFAQTMAFTSLVIMQLFAVMSMRTFNTTLKNLNLFTNKALFAGIIFSLVLQVLVVYVPFLQTIFGTVALSLSNWLLIFGTGVLSYLLFEVSKKLLPEPVS